jgi:hypothetical protein
MWCDNPKQNATRVTSPLLIGDPFDSPAADASVSAQKKSLAGVVVTRNG